MPRRIVARCDGETDLVVELRRSRNVAFLLDMESHAGGTGLNAATIRSELPGDNWVCVLCSYGKFWAGRKRLGRGPEWARQFALLVGEARHLCERYRV